MPEINKTLVFIALATFTICILFKYAGADTWPLVFFCLGMAAAYFIIEDVLGFTAFSRVCLWISATTLSLYLPLKNLSANWNGETWAIIPSINASFKSAFAAPKPEWATIGDEMFKAKPYWFATTEFLLAMCVIPLILIAINFWRVRRFY